VTFGVFHILDAAITAQKLSESRLALYVGFAAHVFFAEHQKVEGEGSGPGIIRTTVQGFKVSDTIGSSQTASASRMAEPFIRAASCIISG
jgi:hypothetical protein